MNQNIYESVVLINAALDDEQIDVIITRIKEAIVNNGGEIKEIENWGRKRLAYTVNKSKIGYYVIFMFNAPSNIVSKLERFYTLEEHILRFLTIKLDNEAIEQLEKNKTQLVSEIAETDIPVAEPEESPKEFIKESDNN